jgi:hypothetical protein
MFVRQGFEPNPDIEDLEDDTNTIQMVAKVRPKCSDDLYVLLCDYILSNVKKVGRAITVILKTFK